LLSQAVRDAHAAGAAAPIKRRAKVCRRLLFEARLSGILS
jgi:hypothetical protein